MTIKIHEVLFPTLISYGAVGGDYYQVDGSRKKSGDFSANIDWTAPLQIFNVAFGVKTNEQIQQVLSFFGTKKGSGTGFRFWFPLNEQVTRSFFGRGDGVTDTFYLRKIRDSGYWDSTYISATSTTNVFTSTNPNEFRDLDENELIEFSGWSLGANNGLFTIISKLSDSQIQVNSDLDDESAGQPIRMHLYCEIKDISKPIVGGQWDRFHPDPKYPYQTVPKIYINDTEETNVTIDETSAEVVFTTPPAAKQPLFWDGFFHLPAHFRENQMMAEIEFYNTNNINEILVDELLHVHPVGVFG